MKPLSCKKGQFSIIAALLVSIVLVTAIVTTYSLIRYSPIRDRPQILGTISEMNIAIDRVLEFVVGHYGSILQVTGNTTYAKILAANYLQGSLENIAHTHPDWSPSFQIDNFHLATSWFNRTSSSEGILNITYSLLGLGISGVQYGSSAKLSVIVNPSTESFVLVNVTRNGNRPYSTLISSDFFFYNFSYSDSTWELDNTGVVINSVTSTETQTTYNITYPEGVDPSAYMLHVVDSRGIIVTASTFSHYTYTFTYNQTLYSPLNKDTMVVEILQNGTLRWLGEKLQLTTSSKPIPPIPVRAFRLNQTINGMNREVPLQTEDWGSNYKVPAGLTSNVSIFSNRQMFAFLVNHNIENVTLWWDGRDIANQTDFAWKNRYFNDDPDSGVLSNGELTLQISSSFIISSTVGSSVASAEFLRINGESPVYGADPSYVIYNGSVRDITQQEAEWGGGIAGCPNIYAQIVLTLPANATYYTYALRTIFVNSSQSRTITDLSALQLSVGFGQPLTENGTIGDFPLNSTAEGLYYNFSSFSNGWAHHWSEFITNIDAGSGIMFTDSANNFLYYFDDETTKRGAVRIINASQEIELNPVAQNQVSFTTASDITWIGAIVTFDGTDPIFSSSGSKEGLWVLVEHPPTIALTVTD